MDTRSLFIAFITVSLALSSGCAGRKKEANRTTAAPPVLGTHYTTLVFGPGETELNEMNKRHLNSLAQKAARGGHDIDDIKILAWADKEYPETNKRPHPNDVILAKKRAQSIKSYLEDDLRTDETIGAYNMAKKPHLVSKLFKNDEWTVKEAFEKSGATSSRLPDGSISYTKASKALVIIDYAEDSKL